MSALQESFDKQKLDYELLKKAEVNSWDMFKCLFMF